MPRNTSKPNEFLPEVHDSARGKREYDVIRDEKAAGMLFEDAKKGRMTRTIGNAPQYSDAPWASTMSISLPPGTDAGKELPAGTKVNFYFAANMKGEREEACTLEYRGGGRFRVLLGDRQDAQALLGAYLRTVETQKKGDPLPITH